MPTFDRLEIHALGQVVINWRLTPQRLCLAPHEEALLIYLVYHRIPITRAHLCNLFWPEEMPHRAHGNLRKLLLDARKRLGEIMVVNRERVGLHKNLDYWLDVHEFQWQMQPLAQLHKAPGGLKEIELPRLRQGVQLYRGEFLADFKPPKSRLYGQWIEQEQQSLLQQVTTALKLLMEGSTKKQQYTEAIDYATRQLQLDPLDEETHEQIMRLWAHTGQIEQALQHYHAYRQFLKKAMDSEPEPPLALLYQQIRTGTVPHLTQEERYPLVQMLENGSLSPKPIPKPLTPLLGRATVLNQLQSYLTDPKIRLVTLVGMGGAGKTHTVLALMEQHPNSFADRIVFVSLGDGLGEKRWHEENDPKKVLHGLVLATTKALNIASDATVSSMEQLVAYVQPKQLLLIFDGYEPVAVGAQFLAQLLQEAPLLKLLITTRECLQLPGEAIIHLEGLLLPPLEDSRALTNTPTATLDAVYLEEQAPSLQLLLTCIQRQTTGLVWQRGSLRPLRQICHLVEGIPLAIELAATLFVHYSGQEIVEHLQEDLTLLSTTSHARAQRHQSMNRVLEDCWDRLSTQEQALLVRLTIFVDRFSRHAALAVTGSVPETLVALVNKSLVRSKGAGFYEIPRLVRLFANHKWEKSENQESKNAVTGYSCALLCKLCTTTTRTGQSAPERADYQLDRARVGQSAQCL